MRRIVSIVGMFLVFVWILIYADPIQISYHFDDGKKSDLGPDFIYESAQDFDYLLFSSYIGGSEGDSCNSIAIDSIGDIYLTGYTESADFPSISGYDSTHNGDEDCFVMKLNSTGTGIIYSTFLGGYLSDVGRSIAVDSSGCAYVTGITSSPDFPVQNSYQSENKGFHDCFIAKISADGDSLVYSTFVGGIDTDIGNSIYVDEVGNAYVAGSTSSSDFPTINSFDNSYDGGNDGFALKLDQTGNVLKYCTFMGGSGTDAAHEIVVDTMGCAYICGETGSTDFPTQSGYDHVFNGDESDCFVTKLNDDGALNYSTFIGGSNEDKAHAIAVDDDGYAYIAGQTTSDNFPTVNPYKVYRSSWDCFVSKLSQAGNSLLYSTLIGGSDADAVRSICLNTSSSIIVTGFSSSTDFPTANGFDSSANGGIDGIIFELNISENDLLFSSYYGSSEDDTLYDVDTDSKGSILFAGWTESANYPIKNALEPIFKGDSSGCVSKLIYAPSTITTTTSQNSTPPHDLTTNDDFKFGLVEFTIMGIVVGSPIIAIIGYTKLKSKRKEQLILPMATGVSTESVEVLRGAGFIGNRLRYKVKIVNNSDTIINDVTVTIVSYPRDSLSLNGNATKSITKIEPSGFRSPTFEFLPSQDCVKGNIAAAVSFVDSRGNLHSVNAEPYTVRAVCDLLQPEQITADQFESKISKLEHGDMTVKVEEWTPEEMHTKTLQVLENTNFSNVITETQKLLEYIEFKEKGWAKGKYTGKEIGIEVTITGKPGMKGATCKIVVSGEDSAMIMPAIDEVSQKLSAWLCPNCGAKLNPEDVSKLSEGKTTQCSFCGVSINR